MMNDNSFLSKEMNKKSIKRRSKYFINYNKQIMIENGIERKKSNKKSVAVSNRTGTFIENV